VQSASLLTLSSICCTPPSLTDTKSRSASALHSSSCTVEQSSVTYDLIDGQTKSNSRLRRKETKMDAPYTVNIDQQAARHYADKGATILLLDVPEQTHVAFDHQVSLL